MRAILDIVTTFFKEDDWSFQQLEGQPILQIGFQGDNGQWTCFAMAREEQAQFVFYSVCATRAPEARRPTLAEFLTRANYGLIIGNFELDWGDGEVRYKTSLDVEGDRLTPALVKQMAYANVVTMDRYLPGIMRVMYGDVSPAEAMVEIDE
jgi:hypothetical protein